MLHVNGKSLGNAKVNDMSNVIPFTGITKFDLDADITLEANKGKLEGFVLCGYTKDGEEMFVSTYSDGGTALWLLEKCKKTLLETVEDPD